MTTMPSKAGTATVRLPGRDLPARLREALGFLDLSRRRVVRSLVLLVVFAAFMAVGMGIVDFSFFTRADDASGAGLARGVQVDLHASRAVLTSLEFLVLAGVGLVLVVLLPVLSPIQASVLTLAAMVPVAYLGYAITKPFPLVPMEFSLLTILVLFALNVLASYFEETAAKQRLIAVFGQYVPKELARRIHENPDAFSLSGEAREMTIMFCDIKDFTAVAERLDPTRVVEMLNALYTPISRVIHEHYGTIDKYLGDGIMAFWGAPAHDPRHASNAVLCAEAIQRTLEQLRRDLAARGFPEISMGIGLSSGMVNVGNMGSEYRVAYTVVGDPVNEASRLESLTRDIGSEIVVSETVRTAVPEVVFRELALVRLKGRKQITRAYEPVCRRADLTAETEAWLERHREALDSYYARQWDRAVTLFGRLWEQSAPDNRLYEIYLKNIARFTQGPRPFDWQGELDLKTESLFEPDPPGRG